MKRSLLLATVAITTLFYGGLARATFFDFTGIQVSPPPNATIVTLDGIRITLSTDGTGNLTSTTTRFGIDNASGNDVADLIDGGGGSAEELVFLVTKLVTPLAVVLDSVLISEFD